MPKYLFQTTQPKLEKPGIELMKRWHLYSSILIAFLAGMIIYVMGRPLIASSGVIKLWHGVVYSSENSQHLTDWYTLSHITHGILFFAILRLIWKDKSAGVLLIMAIGLESLWEVIENTDYIINRYRATTISLDYFGDSVINSVMDIFAALLGFLMAWRLPVFASIALVVTLELGMAYAIHDNLTLNIIMLLYPIEAIKNWQKLGGPFSH